jgi:hypothetical protein
VAYRYLSTSLTGGEGLRYENWVDEEAADVIVMVGAATRRHGRVFEVWSGEV